MAAACGGASGAWCAALAGSTSLCATSSAGHGRWQRPEPAGTRQLGACRSHAHGVLAGLHALPPAADSRLGCRWRAAQLMTNGQPTQHTGGGAGACQGDPAALQPWPVVWTPQGGSGCTPSAGTTASLVSSFLYHSCYLHLSLRNVRRQDRIMLRPSARGGRSLGAFCQTEPRLVAILSQCILPLFLPRRLINLPRHTSCRQAASGAPPCLALAHCHPSLPPCPPSS